MQTLDVNLSIPIPSDMIIISKVKYEELKNAQLYGVYWNMKDLENRTGKKHMWIKENILFQPRFKRMLDVKTGGFVHYPQSSGQPWAFHAKRMADFLDTYFAEIFSKAG